MNATHPEGRIARGLTLDSNDGVVVRIDPDSSSNEVFVFSFWGNLQDVGRPCFEVLLPNNFEIVIRRSNASATARVAARSGGLFAQQFLENMLAN